MTAVSARSNTAFLSAALRYAHIGWPVIPLTGKKPLTTNGSKDGTCDEQQIRAWSRQWPHANVGLPTAIKFWVLDIDTKSAGDLSLEQLEAKHGRLPDTIQQITGTGGRHYLFALPSFAVHNSTGKVAQGIDVRGVGGYIVAAPSIHPETGRAYSWDGLELLGKQPLLPAPDWLLLALRHEEPSDKIIPPKIPKGKQHTTLVSIAGSMRKRGMEFPEIFAALKVINEQRCTEPAPVENIRRIAESICRYAAGQMPTGRPTEPLQASKTCEPIADAGLRFFPRTDSGNGERIARKFSGAVLYCAPQHSWYLWTGKRWEPDQTGEMLQRTKLIARELYDEAGRLDDSEKRKACAEWARKCESADRRRAALFLAQSEPGIAVLPAEFDADPFALNCLNGTVNLRTGELREHRPEDLITRLAPVEYDSTARSELWERFLEDSTGGDKELRDFLQRAAGYSLTGSVCEEVLFFVHGPTASGKSTFLETLRSAFGDYSKVADFESFIARRDAGAIRNDIAELAGRRFVVSIEVDEGRKLAEGLVKLLTGGDTVRARFLYQEAFEFAPSFKLWLAANHAPRVRDNDSAIWRRILRLPFEHIVPKEQRDPTLKARLRDPALSGPAILAWAAFGCLRWQEDGLCIPAVVEEATEAYRADMDPLRPFFEERCDFEPDAWCSVAMLRSAYEAWAKESGERYVLDGRQFAERLREHGCIQKPTRAGRGWSGIALKENR